MNQVKWKPNDQALPFRLTKKGHEIPWWGWLLMPIPPLLLLPFMLASAVGVLKGQPFDPIVSLGIFVLCALLMVPFVMFALNQFFLTKDLEISSNVVSFRFRDIRRRQEWIEPLPNYQGVRLAVNHGRPEKQWTWHIELVHQDPAKCITLYSPNLLRRHQFEAFATTEEVERFSAMLKVPLLEPKHYYAGIGTMARVAGRLTDH